MEYTVKIEDVTFGYGDRLILQNVSMKFGAGKVVAIMGGSGMGKTTLLKLIGGLLTPQGGRVEVTGETLDPSNQKRLYRIRRRMGMLFQFGALFTDLSVFDNVAFPMREQTDLDEETIRDLVLMKLARLHHGFILDLLQTLAIKMISRNINEYPDILFFGTQAINDLAGNNPVHLVYADIVGRINLP